MSHADDFENNPPFFHVPANVVAAVTVFAFEDGTVAVHAPVQTHSTDAVGLMELGIAKLRDDPLDPPTPCPDAAEC